MTRKQKLATVREVAKEGRSAKWHFGLATSYGNLSMGSGDKPVVPSGKPRSRTGKPVSRTTLPLTSGASVVHHAQRELVTNVLSSQSFSAVQYRIQPADETTFPWLSSIAAKYQKWRCRALRFEYVPTVGEFADAGKQGRVVIAANYDTMDAILTNIREAETIKPNCPGLPTEAIRISLEPRMVTSTPLVVRNGLVQPGMALANYDGGVVYVAVEGIDSSVTDGTKLGELFVEYDIEFLEPILTPVTSIPAATHSSYIESQWDVTTSFPLDSTYRDFPDLFIRWNGCGLKPVGNTIVFQPGRYAITISNNVIHTASGCSKLVWRLFADGGTITQTEQIINSDTGATYVSFSGTAVLNLVLETTIQFQYYGTGAASGVPQSLKWPAFLCQTI